MKLKLKKGDEVRIKFLDHTQGSTRLVCCTLYGRVYKVTKKKVVVEPWVCNGDQDCQDRNNERFALVRSAIREVVVFED